MFIEKLNEKPIKTNEIHKLVSTCTRNYY